MIRSVIASLVANVVALYVAVVAVSGFGVTGGWKGFVLAAVVLGLANVFVKPLLRLVSLPFIFLSMGVFVVVINGVLLWLTEWLVAWLAVHPGLSGVVGECGLIFEIWSDYLWAAVVVGLVNYALGWFLKLR